jgi:hypothetical protein
MKTNSSQRTKHFLEEKGYILWKTEHWNPFAHKRVDMWNCCDFVGLKDGETFCFQATGADVKEHVKKIQESPYFAELQKSKWLIYLLSWRKLKKVKGKKATYWDCKIQNVFEDSVIESTL